MEFIPMNPQEASTFVTKLNGLFQQFSQGQSEVLQTMLEKFPSDAATAAISRLAEETSHFDRGRLKTLLVEEHGRRASSASPTAGWRAAKVAEVKAIDEVLESTPKGRLLEVVSDLRKSRPELFKLCRADPLESDLGRSLVYEALRNGGSQCR
jgi:hypothetical protein